jgi:hypothetical protein
MKTRIKTYMIVAAAVGAVCALLYVMSTPGSIVDKTPGEIEGAKDAVRDANLDVEQHNIKTVTEVKVIRETIKKDVAALTPDELVLSVDEFIGRWRGYSDKPPAGSAGLDGSGKRIFLR